ncbi:MAG TPA: acylphosphatase [Dongiaceae bacterium]|jgi:acylphosphatase|nr:acylphosphatase [Dongiaceae bacterium]
MGQASLHAIVYGRVQGVNFRHYTAREGERLALRGWVRNLPDGTVEVEAAGDPASLDALFRWLQHGPPAARVERVESTPGSRTDLPPGFHITG